ncbi:putative PAP2 superfamily [Blattamonas nauphoetae]|uniref:PAP2 superfamily n=1 Tax=Blattamonas nauphoetae TaxID=2049346 RepID=A0ABQ9XP37_9EUKA|nr:putative PAP2 superfamily [Blattamonas nauphoetae]
MKVTLSRLRPDFLSRCLPDLKETKRIHEMQLRQHGFLTAYPYQCTGDDSIIREGRLSFPSGHSSISMWSTTVCIGFAALAAISHRKRQKNRQSSHRTIPQIEEQLSIPSTFSSVEHSSKDAIYSVPRKPAYFRCESNIQSGSTLSLILTVASLLPLLTTCFIAITRIVDHRHHPSDIFGGITVGGLSGLWTLLLVYHTI